MNDKQINFIACIEKKIGVSQQNGYAKFCSGIEDLETQFSRQKMFYLFAICPRWFEKKPISSGAYSDSDWARSDWAHSDWAEYDPFAVMSEWQWPQLVRLLLLLKASTHLSRDEFIAVVQQLYDTADVNELILLVQSLGFIPYADAFVVRAREAARSNMANVFSAIAHRSDFAYRYFDENGWNQLILKAAFLAESIWDIHGLRARNNAELVTMLKNYVRERQAASRTVPWDIWCCIAWLACTQKELDYIQEQFLRADVCGQGAIKLALQENESLAARALAETLDFTAITGQNDASPSIELPGGALSWTGLARLNK